MSADVASFVLKKDDGTTLFTFDLPLANLAASASPGVSDDDTAGYVAGSLWADTTHHTLYICASNATGAAVWNQVGSSSLTDPVTAAHGGTGLTTLTAHAVLLGEGTSNVGFATIGTAGRLLIDQGAGADPSFNAMSGDATLANTGALTIGNDKVTYAKMQNVSATSRILGRKTAGAGDPEECTLSDVLDFVGSAAQGDILYRGAASWARLGAGTSGQVLTTGGAVANPSWADAGTGTVTTVSVASANGFAGSVANATTTPAITISTTVTGLLKGNGTAISAAVADTDYTTPTGLAAYAQPLDGDLTALAALSGTNTIYYRSGASTWSAVTIGSNLTFSAGTLDGKAGTVTSVSGTSNQVSVANGTTTPVISLAGPHNFTTQTSHGILLGAGTSAIAATAAMSDGQLLVGQTGADPLPKSITGDVAFSAAGAATIANDAVTYAKMQNVSATSRILGRKTAGAGDTEECTLSEVLDFIGSAAQGDILYRGSSSWARLGAGTAGQVLKTGGAGANPSWAASAPKGYIYGLKMAYSSLTLIAFSVGPGIARDSTDATTLTLSSGLTVDATAHDVAQGNVRKTLTGTVATTSGNATVTGTSTAFLTEFGTRAITGTVSTTGTAATGSGTLFLSEVAVGDLIGNASNGYSRIAAIASDTALTLDASIPGGNLSGATCNCIENATINIDPLASGKQVKTITSNTSLAATSNWSSTASGKTAWAGEISISATGFFGYAWLVSGASGTSVIASTQRTTPWLPSGYDVSYRRIGVFRLDDSSSSLTYFMQTGNGNGRKYVYEVAQNTQGTGLLTGGTATSWTTVVASGSAPPTATLLGLVIGTVLPAATQALYVRARNTGTSTTTRNTVGAQVASAYGFSYYDVPCDGAQCIEYVVTGSNAGYVSLVGYTEYL